MSDYEYRRRKQAEQDQGPGCGGIILMVILIAAAPFILQVIGFILFILFAQLLHG
jgi:hypothetical protein